MREGVQLRALRDAADAQDARESRGLDVETRVLVHLRGELARGEEHERGGEGGGGGAGARGRGGRRAVDGGTAGGVGGAERVREREEVRERLARARGGLDEDVEAMDDDRAERALLDRGQVRDAQRAEARLGVLRREGSARGGEGREAGGERASGGGRGRRRRRRRARRRPERGRFGRGVARGYLPPRWARRPRPTRSPRRRPSWTTCSGARSLPPARRRGGGPSARAGGFWENRVAPAVEAPAADYDCFDR